MTNLREARVSVSSGTRRVDFRLPVEPRTVQVFLLTALYDILGASDGVHGIDSVEASVAGSTGTTGGGDPDLDPDPKAGAVLVSGPAEPLIAEGAGTTGGGDPDLDPDPTH